MHFYVPIPAESRFEIFAGVQSLGHVFDEDTAARLVNYLNGGTGGDVPILPNRSDTRPIGDVPDPHPGDPPLK